MSSNREKHSSLRTGIVVFSVAIALFLALTSAGHRVSSVLFSPFVSLANWFAEGTRRVVRAIQPGTLGRSDELAECRRRLGELEVQLEGTQDLQLENEELRRLVLLPPRGEWRAVFAEVISRDPVQWNDKLLVNRGSEDGLVTGAVVLVDGKVFGRVLNCYRHSAEVITILSAECRFGVAISGTDAVGVLQGGGETTFLDGRKGFVVDYLPKDLKVTPEMTVVTSGLGGWVPAGIPVGEILPDGLNGSRVHLPDAARGMIHGIPFAPFGAFHFVAVLVPKK